MDLTVTAYLLYLVAAVPLTVWVGQALRRHGSVFLIDVFGGDDALAEAVNRLLVIGFYLVNLGWVSRFMATDALIVTGRDVLQLLAGKLGTVALVIGAVHFLNVWFLNSYRRRAVLRAQGQPPVAPVAQTRVRQRPQTAPNPQAVPF